MDSMKGLRPTPALIVAMAALVLAMSGAAVALPGKATVQTNDLENGAVTSKKIADGAVKSKQVAGKSLKGNRLKDGAVKAQQIADGTITGVEVAANGLDSSNIADYKVIRSEDGSVVELSATDGANEAAARTAAPETQLFADGQISITAKCFRDTATSTTFAEIYVKTSANGAIFDGGTDQLDGGNAATDFLNTDTPETDRVLDNVTSVAGNPNLDENEFTIVSADGNHFIGQTMVAAKEGALAGGNGIYGDGNVCLFGGEIAG